MDNSEKFMAQGLLDAAGNLRIGYKGMTAEDMEALKALNASPHWAVYRKILQSAMAEYMRASTQVVDVNGVVKMLHSAGMAAGMNFAINQLQVLCADYDAKAKKTLEKTTKEKVPFKRG